jgi:hypothetical protein
MVGWKLNFILKQLKQIYSWHLKIENQIDEQPDFSYRLVPFPDNKIKEALKKNLQMRIPGYI